MERRLRTISESLSLSPVNEAHVDTDKMMYADSIAKALQQEKTELGNLWAAEIMNSGSDGTNGNGGGRIRYTIPATPSEVEYQVQIENHRTPGPKLDDHGFPIPGEEISEDLADVLITISIDDNPIAVKHLKDQFMVDLKDVIKDIVVSEVKNHHKKQR